VREILALRAWVAAFVTASRSGGTLAALLRLPIPTLELRLLAGFVGIFFVVPAAHEPGGRSSCRTGEKRGTERSKTGYTRQHVRADARRVIVMVLVLLAGLTSLRRSRCGATRCSAAVETLAMSLKNLAAGDVAQRITLQMKRGRHDVRNSWCSG